MLRFKSLLKFFSLVGLVIVVGASAARAQLTFTIDTFTTEELKITLNAGGSLVGSAVSSDTMLYITADSFNQDWILKDNSASVVGSTASLGDDAFASGGAEDQIMFGDYVFISFGPLVTGESLDGPLQLTMGHLFSGGFNPSAVSNLVLTWGIDDRVAGTQPWGDIQSTVAVSAVPEPSSYALILGTVSLLGIYGLRRRRVTKA